MFRRDTPSSPGSIPDIYFRESLNEGNDWSAPIKISKEDDLNNRFDPFITIERDTGRVILAFLNNDWINFAIRDPNQKEFGTPYKINIKEKAVHLIAKATFDKNNSKRYIHLFFTNSRLNGVYYVRTDDKGTPLTAEIILVRNIDIEKPLSILSEIGRAHV